MHQNKNTLNMNKKIILIAVTLLSEVTYSQVGISNQTPTEMLDINGTTRIRTLPSTGATNIIYTKPDGTRSSIKDQPFNAINTVVSDSNGVLGTVGWLPAQNPIVITGTDGADAIVYSKTVSAKDGNSTQTQTLATKTFTLSKKSLVTLSFNIAVHNITDFNGAVLRDGVSKRIGALLHLDGQVIINEAFPFTNLGNNYTSGYFYLNGNRMMVLNAGTHTINLYGNVFAWNSDTTGVTATFGGTSDDQLDIIAIPLQ